MREHHSQGEKLSFSTQLAYGIADFGPSMAGNILVVFFFFFLTTVAGLPANLAGIILLLSNCWSAISTLLVGVLSDRTTCAWGRRRIWMLASAPILGFSFFLLWWIPPNQDWLKFGYYLAIALLFQTAASAFVVPYGALITDLSDDHNDHLRLNSMRFGFSLAGCIGSLLLSQLIAHWIYNPRQQLFELGLICAAFTVVSIVSSCWKIHEQPHVPKSTSRYSWQGIKTILCNQPLLMLVGIYALSWLAVQITPAILPYFVINCLNLNSAVVTQVVLLMQTTALVSLFIWEPLSKQLGKKKVFALGSIIWIVAEIGLFYLQPGEYFTMYSLAMVAGVGMSTTYFIPASMLPEVIDWDELTTGQRREGLFYSILMFIYQITFAVGLFLVGQWLDWSGFQAAIPGPIKLIQPHSALVAIRQAIVILPTTALIISLILTYFYPINSRVHQYTIVKLKKRRLATSTSS
jgi:GPH family glycoside/pentoside/hexuronide:cation symporter